MENRETGNLNRRDVLKIGGGVLVASATGLRGAAAEGKPPAGLAQQLPCNDGGPLYREVYPTSPLILEPFRDDNPLPNPQPAVPSNPATWTDLGYIDWARPNCRTGGRQDSDYATHQVGFEAIPAGRKTLTYPEPLYYRIALQVSQHQFVHSPILPIQKNGQPCVLGQPGYGQASLPQSTIYGFSTTPNIPNSAGFPGAMIYAQYGQPVCMRLENQLQIDGGLDRIDYGSPEWGFLTHLHNGHTAAESDGNPNHRGAQGYGGYLPGQWCDNLYLNFAPANDPGEKQSFLWFHDHYMHHTGANVYKGMVGLYPLYDPELDPGDERLGLHLPGVPNPVTRRVDYDIPLAFYDLIIDDGVTGHRDAHNGCDEVHPEWWGTHYFRHFPNHGFVGDIFTTNCVAYPVLRVKRRKYRFRLLGASIARIYDFSFMRSANGPVPAGLDAAGEAAYLAGNLDLETANWDANPKKRQGQWRLRDGQVAFDFHQIASEGGLLPYPIRRASVEIWPAKRREFILDFSKYIDGSPTCSEGTEEVVYLVDTYQMTNGRKRTEATRVKLDVNGNEILPISFEPNPDFEPGFCVPMMKIIIEPGIVEDNSVIPTSIRPLTKIDMRKLDQLPTRQFTLHRGGTIGGEDEWMINGQVFEPNHDLAFPKAAQPEVWKIINGGGGWVHPMHFHYEEHRVISRNGIPTPLSPNHPDDVGREDVVALAPGEEVWMYRNFRTFTGRYVAHCHNLAHEDHNMMFGFWVQP